MTSIDCECSLGAPQVRMPFSPNVVWKGRVAIYVSLDASPIPNTTALFPPLHFIMQTKAFCQLLGFWLQLVNDNYSSSFLEARLGFPSFASILLECDVKCLHLALGMQLACPAYRVGNQQSSFSSQIVEIGELCPNT